MLIPLFCESIDEHFVREGNLGMHGVVYGLKTARNILYLSTLGFISAFCVQNYQIVCTLLFVCSLLGFATAVNLFRSNIPFLLQYSKKIIQ